MWEKIRTDSFIYFLTYNSFIHLFIYEKCIYIYEHERQTLKRSKLNSVAEATANFANVSSEGHRGLQPTQRPHRRRRCKRGDAEADGSFLNCGFYLVIFRRTTKQQESGGTTSVRPPSATTHKGSVSVLGHARILAAVLLPLLITRL